MTQRLLATSGTQAAIMGAEIATAEPALATDTGLLFHGASKALVRPVVIDAMANRPAAGIPGRVFWPTDDITLSVDNVTEWIDIVAPSGVSISQLENTLIMLAWQAAAAKAQYDDLCTDSFADQSGVDLTASTGEVYNAAGYYGYTPAVTDQTDAIEPAAVGDVDRQNLKGSITTWTQDSGTLGHWDAAKPDSVEVGCRIRFADNSECVIDAITGDGTGGSSVLLSAATGSQGIAGVYGVAIDGDVAVSQGSYVSETTALPVMTGDASPSPAVATDSSHYDSPYTHAWQMVDGNPATYWQPSTVVPSWAAIDAGAVNAFVPGSWRLRNHQSYNTYQPKRFRLLGYDGSDWDVLDDTYYSADCPQWAIGGWSARWSITTSKAYYAYKLEITTSWSSQILVAGFEVTPRVISTPSARQVVCTNATSQINTSTWAAIAKTGEGAVEVTATVPGSAEADLAVSFDKGAAGEIWRVWNSTASTWRSVVKLDSGTWKYNTAASGAESWSAASTNDRFTAYAEALANQAANQMDISTIEGITNANWAAKFEAGTLDFMVGLQADGDDIPSLESVTVYYSTPGEALSLVSTAWNASANDPDDAFVLVDVEPQEAFAVNTDLVVSVSMDDGSNYEALTLASDPFRTIGGHEFYRADISGLVARGSDQIRTKIYCDKDVRVHAIATGLKWAA